jgi:hypothetical protein
MERERLEMLDCQVPAAQDAYTKRMEKASAQLEAKEKKAQEDADAKIEKNRLALVADHSKKLKLQEDRFKQKYDELQKKIDGLKEVLAEAENRRKTAL